MLGQVGATTYGYLWLPIATLFAAFCLAAFLFWRGRNAVDRWLTQRRSRRVAFNIFVLVCTLLLAWLVDLVDLSEVAEGLISRRDQLFMSLAAIVVVAAAWCQTILWWHTDKWDDRLSKVQEEVLIEQQRREQADVTLEFVLKVSRIFLGVVGIKADRVRKLVGKPLSSPACLELKEAMKPSEQIVRLINSTYELYRDRLPNEYTLRVAYFQLRDKYFEPVHCWNGTTANCVHTPFEATYRDFFRVDSAADKCLTVYVAHTGEIEIVSNAEEADKDQRRAFIFFEPGQRTTIKSIVALPLKRGDEHPPIKHVVTIDTNMPNFFTEQEKKELKLVADNLAHRLLFELDMQELLV